MQEAYSRLSAAHQNIAAALKDFKPSQGSGGVPDLKQRRLEVQLGAPRLGYGSPVFYTKYEIRISDGHLVFTDLASGRPFYKTPVDSADYGDRFLAAVRGSMGPQIHAELDRKD